MKKQLMKRALTAAVAFALIGGTVTAPVGDKNVFNSMINAEAATSSTSYNWNTDTLTLRGNVTKEDVRLWKNNKDVKTVVCEEGTVFPADCSRMFDSFKASLRFFRRQPSEIGKEERLKLIAIKTDDGKVKGRINFYCKALEVTRQAFYDYLDRKNKPWKYQALSNEMMKIYNDDKYNDTYGRQRIN